MHVLALIPFILILLRRMLQSIVALEKPLENSKFKMFRGFDLREF